MRFVFPYPLPKLLREDVSVLPKLFQNALFMGVSCNARNDY